MISDKKISGVCEAYNCSEKAVNQILVSAGNFGKVNLNLCNLCVSKFSGQVRRNKTTVSKIDLKNKNTPTAAKQLDERKYQGLGLSTISSQKLSKWST